MPFYLVKQTILLEAGSEYEAAEKAADLIAETEQFKFEVYLDEKNVWHLIVQAADCSLATERFRRDTAIQTTKPAYPASSPFHSGAAALALVAGVFAGSVGATLTMYFLA